MDIDQLRRRHKAELVERALNIFRPEDTDQAAKSYWLERLLEGHDVRHMLEQIKHGHTHDHEKIRFDNIEKCISSGSVEIIDQDLEFHADGRRKLLINVENRSTSIWKTSPEKPLFAAYHWYDDEGNVHDLDGKRTLLPRPILPGETLAMEMDVVVPTSPGDYQLMATMVMEDQFWMEEKELSVHQMPLTVLEYDGDGLTRHARALYQQLKRSTMEVAH
ncbi:hypothetical protein [Modicisalibacter sp. 'Wilcox']|uniref:hypothetical protein n=1 Tax=Modicisalibacter sp. 'Wilcox' TaxID=2679914 RepID=UPI0013CFD761|nr:hypothetical protein [Modicisalibacter sp. 'Wilcox']